MLQDGAQQRSHRPPLSILWGRPSPDELRLQAGTQEWKRQASISWRPAQQSVARGEALAQHSHDHSQPPTQAPRALTCARFHAQGTRCVFLAQSAHVGAARSSPLASGSRPAARRPLRPWIAMPIAAAQTPLSASRSASWCPLGENSRVQM